jgi:transcriptional regulator with XRE-family HTH domain
VEDFRLGTVIRRVRRTRGWRQVDLADRARVSASVVSRLERGRAGPMSIERVRAVAGALDIRVDLVPRWRAGDLDRLLNRGHSLLHESVARGFRDRWPGWVLVPEVSFAVYGERGVIDMLAWHPKRRAVLVVELKTELVDLNELLGTLDRKRRLAPGIARDRDWDPVAVSVWLVVAESRTSRRRFAAHEVMLRSALPDDRRTVRRWLRDPVGTVAGITFWTDRRPGTLGRASRPIRRVRRGPSSVDRPVSSR